jgi:hypothetical protein
MKIQPLLAEFLGTFFLWFASRSTFSPAVP